MIRKYHEADIEDVIDVWRKASFLAHPFLSSQFLKKEEDDIRNVYMPNTETWVYINVNSLDGFITMMGNEIGAIFVRPERQRCGIGRKLLDHVNQFHNELEVEVFEKNLIGSAFYQRYGFIEIKKHIHPAYQLELIRLKYHKAY